MKITSFTKNEDGMTSKQKRTRKNNNHPRKKKGPANNHPANSNQDKNKRPIEDIADQFEENIDFSGYETDIKALALYLPQFHTFPENDIWWGKGFTEWTNVKKAVPGYLNHHQPRIPKNECGYYDLTNIETIKWQVDLAKQHGIYGFAIYYYWFSGKQLMEKPLEMYLLHKEIDFPFCLIWANENWTRTWDGKANEVLIQQEYEKDDAASLIRSLKHYIEDERYIRINSKPVVGIYSPQHIPNFDEFVSKMRTEARLQGLGEILVWICATDSSLGTTGFEAFVDGEYEFPPRGKGYVSSVKLPRQGIGFNYPELVETEKRARINPSNIPLFNGSMAEWDNSARRDNGYNLWMGYRPKLFYEWNKAIVEKTREREEPANRFIFINAWNEWGEGTYLEPDEKYGYANLNALSKALFGLPWKYE